MKKSQIWQQAQSEELNCWVQISHKLDSPLYIERKKAYWQRFQSILEPHHPYHFTKANYARLLSSHLTVSRVEDIEEDVIWINNETSDAKIGLTTIVKQSQRPRTQRLWQALVSGRVFAWLFLRLLALFGWPAHDFAGNGRSLYRHKLFILQPRSAKRPFNS